MSSMRIEKRPIDKDDFVDVLQQVIDDAKSGTFGEGLVMVAQLKDDGAAVRSAHLISNGANFIRVYEAVLSACANILNQDLLHPPEDVPRAEMIRLLEAMLAGMKSLPKDG